MAMPTSVGLVNKVPCPWCREVDSLDDIEPDLQVGSSIECTACGGIYEITSMKSVTQLWLEGGDNA